MPPMDVKDVRRANMLMLAEKYGSLRKLADQTDTPASYLSNIKNRAKAGERPRTMGDAVARKIESKLGLPRGWLDQQHDRAAERARARAKRLLEIISLTFGGNVTRFSKHIDATEPTILDWLKGEPDLQQTLTGPMARQIEAASGRPAMWLDQDIGEDPLGEYGATMRNPGGADLSTLLQAMAPLLTQEQKEEIDADISHLVHKISRLIAANALSGRVSEAVIALREGLQTMEKQAVAEKALPRRIKRVRR